MACKRLEYFFPQENINVISGKQPLVRDCVGVIVSHSLYMLAPQLILYQMVNRSLDKAFIP